MRERARVILVLLAGACFYFLIVTELNTEPVSKSEHSSGPSVQANESTQRKNQPLQLTSIEQLTKTDGDALCWEKLNSEIGKQNFKALHERVFNDLVGAWYFSDSEPKPDENPSTIEGKFLLALAKAGLLEGKKIKPDETEALRLLQETIEMDPKNSASYIYAALIEDRRGNKEHANELFLMAKRCLYFDTYVTRVSKGIFSHVYTPADLVQAYTIFGSIPVPDYISLRGFLKDRESIKIARQLVRGGASKENSISDLEWFPLDYVIGKSLLNKFEPQNKFPTYQEIRRIKTEKSAVNVEKLIVELQNKCELAALYPMVDFLRNRLSHQQDLSL